MKKIEQQEDEIQEEQITTSRAIISPVSYLRSLKIKQQPKRISRFATITLITIVILISIYLISTFWSQKERSEGINQLQQEQIKLCRSEKDKLEEEIRLAKEQIQKMSVQIQVLRAIEISRQKQEQAHRQQKEAVYSDSFKPITQTTGNSNKLPLRMPFINDQSQKVEDVLYPDQNIRKQRIDFQNQRINFINSKAEYPSLHLAKHNLILDQTAAKFAQVDFANEWKRVEEKFELSKLTTELPMCVISPGYNNNAKFRIEYSLNSIFTQNYTNYKAIIINDASTDGSGDIYRKYFQFYGIDKTRYTYIQNTKRVTALQNFYIATRNHCSNDSIVVTIDADDQFIGRNILKIFNWAYTTKKSGVVYTNFYWYQQPSVVRYGFTTEYNENEKKDNLFRSSPMKFSHLRSYRTELFLKIQPEDLQDQKGNFYTITYDIAMFVPLMELSCGRVNKIQGQYQYLYNVGTGLNDQRGRQVEVDNKIRAKRKYNCDKQFDDHMMSLP